MLSKKEIESIYNRYSAELNTYLIRLSGSRETAEDILHDCFINLVAYSQRNEINMDTLRAFLYRSCHNLAVNRYKKSMKQSFSPSEMYASDTMESIENRDLIETIYRLLGDLDSTSKAVFLLKKEEGYTNNTIAELLGISEKTVRRKLESTLNHLLQHIEKEDILEFLLFICPLSGISLV